MTNDEIIQSSALNIRDAVAAGKLSVEQVARAFLARIDARDDQVKAWRYINPELVIESAKALDAMPVKGPLHGVPIGVKDVILTKDMPTTFNSPCYETNAPEIDAACIATLRQAGALIFGKCDTVEFAAMGHRAKTRNPHDLERTPGGSSSGSAAAVADFQVPISLGTQTGGSMIRPASFNGVNAIKPTWNVVSQEGAKKYSTTLDTIGWYARSVEDLTLLADVFEITDSPKIQTTDTGKTLRLAYCKTVTWPEASDDMQQAFMDVIEQLREAGITVDELPLPEYFDELVTAQDIVMRCEGQPGFLHEFRQYADQLHPDFQYRLKEDMPYTHDDLLDAYDKASDARRVFDKLALQYDGVLTPSALGVATKGLQSTGSANFNRMWTLLHVPCVHVTLPETVSKLPMGFTVVGPRFSDQRTLRTSYRLQSLMNQFYATREEAEVAL